MEIRNKYNLKRPATYHNTFMKNNNSNNIGTIYPLNSVQKYKNALNNLREGLSEIEYLNINKDKSKNMNNNTYSNAPINDFLPRNKEYKLINDKLRTNQNKYLLQIRGKNTSSPINLRKTNNSFIPVTKQNFITLENKNVVHKKLNYSQVNDKTYPKSITDDENIQKRIITTEPKQVNIVKANTNLYQKKINDLAKKIKIFQVNNQKLTKDKNNLLHKISLIENQFKKTKEFYEGELENKNSNIMLLKKEIMKLNILLNKKKEEIDNLKKEIICIKESEIKTLDNNLEKENNNLNETN